jgi:DNA-binding response OmpR family regulator
MPVPVVENSLVALVDDDVHSARLLTRTLGQHGVLQTRWLGDAARSGRLLADAFNTQSRTWPALVIVDLKAKSTAMHDLITAIRPMADVAGSMIVALSPNMEKSARNTLLMAGADAVFERQAELVAYQREIADMIGFWVRKQPLHAVGT